MFNRARVRRRFEVDMAGDATVLLAETVVFGRQASGETAIEGVFRDDWRVRRDGRLIFADAVRLEGAISETLGLAAVAGGAGAVSTIVLVAPDAEDRIDFLRAQLAPLEGRDGVMFGASAWDGRLVVRALGRRGQELRLLLEAALKSLSGGALPRVWNC